jgi:hypothetical protein
MAQAIDTRNEAYHNIQSTLNASRQRVYEIIKNHPQGLTNNEIASIMHLQINKITGRVFELREMGMVSDAGIRLCNISNKRCHIWKDNYGKEQN